MRQTLTIVGLGILLVLAVSIVQANPNNQIYHVIATHCGPGNDRFTQSGFRTTVQGQVGLVTALHGVVGCANVEAIQEKELGNTYLRALTLSKISIPEDVAFFTNPELVSSAGEPLKAVSARNTQELKVIGYPRESVQQLDHPLAFFDNPRKTLLAQFRGADFIQQLKRRGSPSVTIEVLLVRGRLQNGYSGAPVLTHSGRVVGVANGGLAQGFADINWIIPFNTISWRRYNENDPQIKRLRGLNASTLFSSPWTGTPEKPRTGATVTGRIYYNDQPATNTTRAYAVIELEDAADGRRIPADFQYNNSNSNFTIFDVPPGKYTAFVRLESGYPFHIESGGDYHSGVSSLNKDMVIPPYEKKIKADLQVIQSIHLTRPIDNQTRRTNVFDPPERLYSSFYAPSADVFQWDPVSGAAYYQLVIFSVTKLGKPPLQSIVKRLTQPQFHTTLKVSPPGTHYAFRLDAFNSANKHIGMFFNYFKNGSGGWFEFVVIPNPRLNR